MAVKRVAISQELPEAGKADVHSRQAHQNTNVNTEPSPSGNRRLMDFTFVRVIEDAPAFRQPNGERGRGKAGGAGHDKRREIDRPHINGRPRSEVRRRTSD